MTQKGTRIRRLAPVVAIAVLTVGIAGCGGSKAKAGAPLSGTSTSAATPASSSSPTPSPTPSSSDPSASISSVAPLPATSTSTSVDYDYVGKDRDACPWIKAATLAKVWRHDVSGVQTSTGNGGAVTCSFTSSLSTGLGDAPPVVLYCVLTYIGGPGANSPTYFAQVLAKNHVTGGTPVSGVGTKALISGPALYVLTNHGVAVVQMMDPGDDQQATETAIYHAVEHSF